MGVFLLPETETSEVRQSPKEAGGWGSQGQAGWPEVGCDWEIKLASSVWGSILSLPESLKSTFGLPPHLLEN